MIVNGIMLGVSFHRLSVLEFCKTNLTGKMFSTVYASFFFTKLEVVLIC